MSDVVVSVVESATNVTVTEQDVAVDVTETSVAVSTSTVGLQGIPGVGYTGVTSTSTITIGAGLKTFTLVGSYAGAFITGMRIRAIHSDTPTYYLEGAANYVGGGTLIITVDKFNGSGSHNLWQFVIAGEVGQTGATGATGSSGVVSVTAPITNSGSSGSAVIGINQAGLAITTSQVTDFTSGTVASAGTAQQAGTAVYSTTSGTALTISGSITQSQVTNLTTDLAAKAPLASPTFSGTVTFPFTNSGIVHSGTAGVMQVSAAAPGLGYIPYTAPVTGLYSWLDLATVAREDIANAFTVGGHVITNAATAVIPLVVKGASGQSANLQEWQLSTGSTALSVNSVGLLTGTRAFAINQSNSGEAMFVLKAAASQTGDQLAVRDSSANTIAGFSATGRLYAGVSGSGQTYLGGLNLGSVNTVATQLGVIAGAATTVGAVIRGAASQSANIQEWQNSGGTVLAKVDSVGDITARVQRSTFAARFTTTDPSIAIQVNTAAASQTGDFLQNQNSGGTVLSKLQADGGASFSSGNATITSVGIIRGTQVSTNVDYSSLREENSGGLLRLTKQTAAAANPAANQAKIYLRDGTLTGLKLVIRAGTTGAETTILDNIPT